VDGMRVGKVYRLKKSMGEAVVWKPALSGMHFWVKITIPGIIEGHNVFDYGPDGKYCGLDTSRRMPDIDLDSDMEEEVDL
jgi:hypothetical protein